MPFQVDGPRIEWQRLPRTRSGKVSTYGWKSLMLNWTARKLHPGQFKVRPGPVQRSKFNSFQCSTQTNPAPLDRAVGKKNLARTTKPHACTRIHRHGCSHESLNGNNGEETEYTPWTQNRRLFPKECFKMLGQLARLVRWRLERMQPK